MSERRFKTRVREMREKRLLSVTEKILATRGCDSFSVNELASAAGVAKGTVYSHYKSQDELLKAVLAKVSTNLLSRLSTEKVTTSVREKIELLVPTLGEEMATHPSGRLGFPCCLRRSPCPYGGVSELEAMIRSILEEAKAEGLLRGDADPDLAASLFICLLTTAAHRQANAAGTKKHLSSVCSIYLHGLIS